MILLRTYYLNHVDTCSLDGSNTSAFSDILAQSSEDMPTPESDTISTIVSESIPSYSSSVEQELDSESELREA